jgi:Na+-driven multidrug efflux pump
VPVCGPRAAHTPNCVAASTGLLSPATARAYPGRLHVRRVPLDLARRAAATLRIAAPLALANLLQMLVYAMDVIFVARLGEQQLAASSLSIALFGLMMWCFSGMTGMVAALIAAELGSRSHAVREVRRSARMALWLAVCAAFAA